MVRTRRTEVVMGKYSISALKAYLCFIVLCHSVLLNEGIGWRIRHAAMQSLFQRKAATAPYLAQHKTK